MTTPSAALRAQLRRILSWQDAHVGFEKAVEGLAPRHRGVRVSGFPHSAWELVEHLRITQRDILDFCVADSYEELRWPEQYWPESEAPPNDAAVLARDGKGRAVLWQIGTHAFGFAAHPGIKVAMVEDLVMEFEEGPAYPAEGLRELKRAQPAIEDALVPVMTGLIQLTGWMKVNHTGR